MADVPLSTKGEQTRAAIVTAAMALFRERGYDKTTMRAIADEAEVSLGNAYYYFASKEHLVQAFYDQIQTDHAEAASRVLDQESSFAKRLLGVQLAFLDVAEPYQQFGSKFFKNAAEPSSPLSPFSPESAPAREASIGIFKRVVAGSDLKAPTSVLAELPELLWLMHMGVVLFWVHDSSPGQARSRALVRQSAPLVDKLVRLTRLPGVGGVVGDVVDLIKVVKA